MIKNNESTNRQVLFIFLFLSVSPLTVYAENLNVNNNFERSSKVKGSHYAICDTVRSEIQKEVLLVQGAWIREAHPNAIANAGYLTIINNSKESIELVSAYSNAYIEVEFHEMAMVGGMMEMRELKDLEILPGGELNFMPGGKHLMLKRPRKRLTHGDQVEVVLKFSNGDSQLIKLDVKKDI